MRRAPLVRLRSESRAQRFQRNVPTKSSGTRSRALVLDGMCEDHRRIRFESIDESIELGVLPRGDDAMVFAPAREADEVGGERELARVGVRAERLRQQVGTAPAAGDVEDGVYAWSSPAGTEAASTSLRSPSTRVVRRGADGSRWKGLVCPGWRCWV